MLLALLGSNALLPLRASAQASELPRSLGRAALADAMPFSFEPLGLRVEDFALTPERALPPGMRARFLPGSLRWVRVSPFLVVPRALVEVEVAGAAGGVVRHAGFAHPLRGQGHVARAELPVALLNARSLSLQIEARTAAGALQRGAYRVRFHPRAEQRAGVAFDSSCSSYAPRVLAGAPPADSFLYVGCRVVHGGAGDGTHATLELMLAFAHAGEHVQIEGVPAAARSEELYTVRVTSAAHGVSLGARGQRVALAFRIPPRLHDGFLGLGFGPYLHAYEEDGYALRGPLALLTIYAGYTFSASTRMVYFNATALQRRGFADNGFYLWLEQGRFFDQRMSFNLLLGANLLAYSRDLRPRVRLSVPQGFELIARDIFGRGRNMTFGAFLYPKLFQRSYYNLWVRWGSAALFAEINYIAWEEPGGRTGVRSQSLGLTFGTPILRFL